MPSDTRFDIQHTGAREATSGCPDVFRRVPFTRKPGVRNEGKPSRHPSGFVDDPVRIVRLVVLDGMQFRDAGDVPLAPAVP